MGDSKCKPLRLDFDRDLKPEFHGSRVMSNSGLLAYRELDVALGPTLMVGGEQFDPRMVQNVRPGRYVMFQMAEFTIPPDLFADIPRRLDGLGPQPTPT